MAVTRDVPKVGSSILINGTLLIVKRISKDRQRFMTEDFRWHERAYKDC